MSFIIYITLRENPKYLILNTCRELDDNEQYNMQMGGPYTPCLIYANYLAICISVKCYQSQKLAQNI